MVRGHLYRVSRSQYMVDGTRTVLADIPVTDFLKIIQEEMEKLIDKEKK